MTQFQSVMKMRIFGTVPANGKRLIGPAVGIAVRLLRGSILTLPRAAPARRSSEAPCLPEFRPHSNRHLALPDAILGKRTGRPRVKKFQVFERGAQKKKEANSSNVFVFCDKGSGSAQFRGTSNGNPDCTIERIAGLMAMQCLVRGQDPKNFEVLVPAENALVERLVARAEELLEQGRAVSGPSSLSGRQREVLRSVMENLANKEIASKLNITVRTVKFHISTLLSKFGVESRSELARRATGFMRPMVLDDAESVMEHRNARFPHRDFSPAPVETPLQIASKARNIRLAGRVLTA